MIGQRVSHFDILEQLGQGGMGVVYKARDVRLDRLVAMKFLPPHLLADADAEQRFLREAKAASALDHPNICTVYEIDETDDGRAFIAMAFLEGETLDRKIARGPLASDEAVRLAMQIARGLAAAHAHGIIHRDIKPGNIVVTGDGLVKIVDFGIATLAGAARVTATDTTAGTVAYLSPEQARGDAADPRTDIWSLGVVLFEMLTAELPFKGQHPQAVIFSILHDSPRPPAKAPRIPVALARIVRKALAKDPARRYQIMQELLADLTPLAAGETQTAVVHLEPRAGRWRWRPGSRRGPLVAAAVALAVIATLLAVWRFRRPFTDAPPAAPATAVAVLPFSYQGNPSYRYLGEGLVDLLSASLDGAGELRAIDPQAIAGLAGAAAGIADPAQGRTVAQRLAAEHFVLGGIVEIGGRLQIRAAVYEARQPREPLAQATAQGEVGKAFELVDQLAIGLLAGLGQGFEPRINRVAAVTTSSLPALKAYLDGESAFRRGDFRSSIESLQRAVALDERFALAWYRLSMAYEWLGTRQELHLQAAEQAHRHADRLTDRERRLLEALRVWRQGSNQEARRLYSAIVRDYPDEIEGWYQFGEVLFHRNALYGSTFTTARQPFERVLAYEPAHFPSMLHLARIEAFEGRGDAMRALIERFLRLGTESADRTLEVYALEAFSSEDGARQGRVLAQLEAAEGTAVAMSFLEVSLYTRNLAGSERIARLLVAPARPPQVRSFGHVALAHLHLARGRLAAAKSELAKLGAFDPWASLEHRALFASLPFVPAKRAELAAIHDALADLDPGAAPVISDPQVFIDAHSDLHPLLRMYLLALTSVRMGELERATEYAAQIPQQTFPPAYASLAADLAASIGAQIDRTQGNPASALSKLEGILSTTTNPMESP